jgi:hypothetical protein
MTEDMNTVILKYVPVVNLDDNEYNEKNNICVVCLSVKSKNKICRYIRKIRKGFHEVCSVVVYERN